MRLVFDIETDGFLESLTTIHCLTAIDIDTLEEYSFRPSEIASGGLKLLSQATELWGHNILKFDIPSLQKVFPDFKPTAVIRDTLICSRLIWPEIKEQDFKLVRKKGFPPKLIGKHSLEAWGRRLGDFKGDFKGPWDTFTEEMFEYCKQDSQVTLKLVQKILDKEYSEVAIQLEHDFAAVIWEQEKAGVGFNVQAAAELYKELTARRLEIEKELKVIFPPLVEYTEFTPKKNNKTKGWIAGETVLKEKITEFNPGSRDHIAKRLKLKYNWKPTQFTDAGKPQVDESVLGKLEYPEAKVLTEYLLLQKRIGQLAEGDNAWLKLEKNGRIHGQVITNGAVTGRCTHNRPNLAQVPRVGTPYGSECRSLFSVDTGRCLLGFDASGLELRCLAHYMARYDGGAYIRVLIEGDIHTENQKAAGLPTRNDAKTFIYMMIYGGGDEKAGSIVGGSALEGKKIKAKFFKKIPALKTLMDEVKSKSQKQGYLKGLDGRILTIRSPHSALNTLLQSAGAIIVKKATVLFHALANEAGYISGKHYQQVLHIHDEVQVEVFNPEDAEALGLIAKEALQKAGEFFNFRCPITGEFKVGNNWKETH